MLRNILLALAGALVTGLLVFLMIQSSAVDSEYYVDYGTRINLLRQGETDFATLSEAAQNAYREGRAVPNSAMVALQRLQSGRDELNVLFGDAGDPRVAAAFAEYDQALSTTTADVRRFISEQRELADAVSMVRNESPTVVRDLRRFGLQAASQTVFGVAVEIMDYASGIGGHSKENLATRIESIEGNDDVQRRLPGKLDVLLEASRAVLSTREQAAGTLSRIETSAVPGASRTLQTALREINRSTVGRADRARTLLAIFSILFLGGIAYTAIKLRGSYGQLRDSKVALEQLNQSLEERVEARTEQLSSAYEELKESQSQLVHAEKMSSLGELVAGISHEINTPLWYLLSNSSMLKERLESFDDFVGVAELLLDQLRHGDKDKDKFVKRLQELDNLLQNEGLRDDLEESLDLISDSIEGLEQLAEMAQSLKDFSRLDRAAVDRFNVNEGLEKSLLIGRNFLKNRVEVNKHFGEVPPIMCAPSQINQIFLNLIKNASDAIENEGTIDLTTRHDDTNVYVEVKDSGPGIPADVMDKIRDPFFTTKEVGKGTGLGLSIVDKIISSHNGELRIESPPGQGARFTVVLPIDRRPVSDETAQLEAEIDALDEAADMAEAV
ncbi:MAG: ATP-binding protein [Pseudomonadota bacterium]